MRTHTQQQRSARRRQRRSAIGIDGHMTRPDDRLFASPGVCSAIVLPPALRHEFSGQIVLRRADFVEQFVECFGCELLTGGEWAKHVDQEQADAEDLRQRIVAELMRRGSSARDHIAYPLPAGDALATAQTPSPLCVPLASAWRSRERHAAPDGRASVSASDSVFRSGIRASHFSGAPRCT